MYAPVLIMRWYKVQGDMRVNWCSAADADVAAKISCGQNYRARRRDS